MAALMLTHGLPKMDMLFSGDPIQFPLVMGMSPALSLALAVFAEVFCSVLLLTGMATRLATIPLIITMSVAVLSVHAADAFAKKEMAILYLVSYVILLLAGSGKYSIDHLFQGKQLSDYHPEIKPEDPTRYIYR